jgi:hypothetical protein
MRRLASQKRTRPKPEKAPVTVTREELAYFLTRLLVDVTEVARCNVVGIAEAANVWAAESILREYADSLRTMLNKGGAK